MIKTLSKFAQMIVTNAQVVVGAGYFFLVVACFYLLEMILCTLGCLLIV